MQPPVHLIDVPGNTLGGNNVNNRLTVPLEWIVDFLRSGSVEGILIRSL